MRLAGKTVVITGGGAGLGRVCAGLFATEGANVVVADFVAARAEQSAELIRSSGGRAIAVHADVRVEQDMADLADRAVDEFGRLDVMFANAGIRMPGGTVPFEEVSLEAWRAVFDVNVTGTFLACREAARVMKPARAGTILITSSAAALVGYPTVAGYAATKGAVNAMVRTLALDLGQFGIRVNAICPTHGMAQTFRFGADADVDGLSYEEAQGDWDPSVSPIPLKLARPPGILDSAYAALFLCSDEAAYMSGVCMPVSDGGTLSRVAMVFEMDANVRPIGLPPRTTAPPPTQV
jgi:NAD(P)-dependent dehydrogenase (short-subunit alcohol dehydrogenase family)